jgi:hypothetical protein
VLKGSHQTPEARKKMSIVRKGRRLSEEHKRKIGLAVSGERNYWFGLLCCTIQRVLVYANSKQLASSFD